MQISVRALLSMLHGMVFGGLFIALTFGVVIELARADLEAAPAEWTPRGAALRRYYLLGTAILGWLTVFAGAYLIYPWYRARPPADARSLPAFPQAFLQSNPSIAGWHEIGMEWKEHLAWLAPIAMTAVVYLLLRHRVKLRADPGLRRTVLAFALIALFAAATAGFFGAMINKQAPVRGGAEIHLEGARP